MVMKQCAQGGHYYDASIHSECPYCNSGNVGATRPPDIGRTAPPDNRSGHTRAPGEDRLPNDDGRTRAPIKVELGIDPVVGWLICVEGKEKGRDYRVHSDNNFIGRSEKMDICIRGDETISRENHAVVSYDTRDKIYYFSPGDGRSIVRLNDKALFATAELHAYDRIEIGMTKLIFMPLCGEKFEWV